MNITNTPPKRRKYYREYYRRNRCRLLQSANVKNKEQKQHGRRFPFIEYLKQKRLECAKRKSITVAFD